MNERETNPPTIFDEILNIERQTCVALLIPMETECLTADLTSCTSDEIEDINSPVDTASKKAMSLARIAAVYSEMIQFNTKDATAKTSGDSFGSN